MGITAIAKIRGLAPSTIANHIEKLSEEDINLDVSYLRPAEDRMEKITEAFKKSGGFALTPVREILGEEYSFEELRLARFFLNKNN